MLGLGCYATAARPQRLRVAAPLRWHIKRRLASVGADAQANLQHAVATDLATAASQPGQKRGVAPHTPVLLAEILQAFRPVQLKVQARDICARSTT